MAYRITLECPKDPNKKYFDKKFFKYSNSMNVYFNDKCLFENINDVEENLPIVLQQDIDIDFEVDNYLKVEYNITIGNIKEYADVTHCIGNKSIDTTIRRKNYVEGSDLLQDDYLITFDVNGHLTKFGKEYHQGASKVIDFSSPYSFPIAIQWYSKKNFTLFKGTTWDHIILRIENGNN